MDVESAELLMYLDNPIRQEVNMLVLSRTEGDGISFPELDLAIQVLKVQGSRVQIGVKAAEAIRVLRSELLGRTTTKLESHDSNEHHALRNRINAVSLAMSVSQRHLERGDIAKAKLALQLISEKLQSVTPAKPAMKKNLNTTGASGPLKVLLVEDNPNESCLLAELLQLNGIEVVVARDGDEAIQLLETQTPDLVLLDMNMPGRDGPSTMQSIRDNPKLRKLRIYAVSGSDQELLGIRIDSDHGVNQWFQKPLQPQSLLQAIRRIQHEHSNCNDLLLMAP